MVKFFILSVGLLLYLKKNKDFISSLFIYVHKQSQLKSTIKSRSCMLNIALLILVVLMFLTQIIQYNNTTIIIKNL